MNEQLDYAAIRRQAEAGLQKEKRRNKRGMFFASLMIFLMFNAIAWGNILTSNGGNTLTESQIGLVAMLSIGWGMAILFHWVSFQLDGNRAEQRLREQMMARELQKEMLRLGEMMDDSTDEPPAKRKRDPAYRLTDDGELLEVIDDEPRSSKNGANS